MLPSGNRQLPVSLRCPAVRFSSGDAAFGGELPLQIATQPGNADAWVATYAPFSVAPGVSVEPDLGLQWYPQEGVLCKSLRLRTEQATTPLVIEDITLETLAAEQLCGEFRPGLPQSYPLFLDGYFAVIEFPVAATRVENGKAYLGHRPLCKLEPNHWYESRRAVYGTAPVGGEVLAFHRYIEAHRPRPKGLHFNYNSWWTSPVPFSEGDILTLMKESEDNLYRKHGVALDSFTIDLGCRTQRCLGH